MIQQLGFTEWIFTAACEWFAMDEDIIFKQNGIG